MEKSPRIVECNTDNYESIVITTWPQRMVIILLAATDSQRQIVGEMEKPRKLSEDNNALEISFWRLSSGLERPEERKCFERGPRERMNT